MTKVQTNDQPNTNTYALPPVLELRGINQTYFDNKTKKDFVVFDNFNLAVEDYPNTGQFIVIMGKSGCGKSTILRYWTGLQKPTSGQIFVGGKALEENQSMPMVFQQYSSLEWFSVLENVALPLTLKGIPKKQAYEHAMEMIKVVGLEGHENKFAKIPQLSGGQLQRVAIARSLVANPNMLLLDEPYGALDGFTRAKMQFFLLELFQKSELASLNPTVVLVTHDPREAVLLGNDIYIMDSDPGRIIKHIKPNLPDHRDRSIRKESHF
ncbi:MAG TPA: ATP-binding cassette domain-containing protein, partial [Flavisolibacter sp.]|nr:ATP-binding cassette domain-containing protein [Flavisolibacter sp.]